MSVEVSGTAAPGFEPVRDAFAANLAAGIDTGAACTVYVHGEEQVNLWGGLADRAAGRPWDPQTLVTVASTTKGAVAISANLLIERGALDPDRPVADYWPEFGTAGKEDATVAMVLSHRVGLAVIDGTFSYEDILNGARLVEALAQHKAAWEPGTRHGYHALTFGWLAGELVRRASGRTVGRFFAEEVAGPLGLDFYIGLPTDKFDRMVHETREAETIEAMLLGARGQVEKIADPDARAAALARIDDFFDTSSTRYRAISLNGCFADPQMNNDPSFWAAEVPAANACTDARSIARMYAACIGEVDGVRVLRAETVDRAAREEAGGFDEVIQTETRFGLGFMLPTPVSPMLGPSSFGHPGSGGSLGFADRDARVGFGYVRDSSGGELAAQPPSSSLLDALRTCLRT